jgi:hypothetical protein
MALTKTLYAKALASAVLFALPLASDAAGLRFASPAAAAPTCGYTPIQLGPALAPFAVLAGTTITNSGNSVVSSSYAGDNNSLMGVWPGSSITGFYPPGLDSGGRNDIYSATFNTNSGVPMAAQSRLTTVYNGIAAMSPTALVSGDLSQAEVPGYPKGTLPPGIYKSASTLSITAGNLHLVRGNNLTVPAEYVFEVGTSLTTTYDAGLGGNVILGRGVDACDVYWQLGDSAVLGGQNFYGSVFAYSSITLAGEFVFGRALALHGAVTMTHGTGTQIKSPGGR